MKTLPRTLTWLLAFDLLALPALRVVAAEDNPAKATDSQANPPAATQVLERTDQNAENQNPTPERAIVLVGKDAFVKEGESCSEVVVVRGNATIDGSVNGDVVVILGTVKVNGTIGGNLVVVLGSAELNSAAEIKHDAVVVGGPLQADPAAKILGSRQEIGVGAGLKHFDPMHGWLGRGLFRARLLPPSAGWWWLVAGMFLVLYLLTALLCPRPLQTCVRTLETKPIASVFSGILAFLLLPPLLLLLAVTGVGLVVVPFVVCAMLVVALLGKVTVYQCTGLQLGRQTGLDALQKPLLALLIGTIVFYLLYTIPILSLVLWGIVAPLGIGAVLIAFFSAFRKEGKTNGSTPPPNPMVAIPVASLAPTGPGAATTPLAAATAASTATPTGVPPVLSGAPPLLTAAPPAATVPPVIGETLLLPRAGFWLRLCAVLLDALLVGGAVELLHLHHAFLLLWVIYHVGLWTWRGTTIGGVVMGIKIFRRDGRPISFGVALVRMLGSFFSFFVLCLGFFWAGWDKEKQSWHDKIAGTIILKMPKGLSLI